MRRGLVDESKLFSPKTPRANVVGDFGEEDNEGKCTTGQPVRIGNVTWTGTRRQTMEGIGASLVFYTNWITEHKHKQEIYDKIFGEMKPSILRMRNSWDSPSQYVFKGGIHQFGRLKLVLPKQHETRREF